MPELPEVETVARNVEPHIINKAVSHCEIMWYKTIATPSVEQFKQQIIAQKVSAVSRRAKYITIKLDQASLLIHLRMSGDLLICTPDRVPQPHDRVAIHFTDGTILVFNDPRKFGRLWLVRDPEVVTGKLGFEPLSLGFTSSVLAQILGSKDRNIKAFLLDQSQVAGLGNIYTDEALFRAGIMPTRKTKDLKMQEIERLYTAIQTVLQDGIAQNGASFDWVYRGGNFQNNFMVYQRKGLPCRICGRLIEKISLGQRGTHYCLNCQK